MSEPDDARPLGGSDVVARLDFRHVRGLEDLYTLFETAKLSGIDPRAYITLAAKRAITDHGAVTLPSDPT